MGCLALFDFDGTITDSDTFTPFIYYAVSKNRLFFGRVILTPIVVAYKLGLIAGSPVRACIVRIGFTGKKQHEVCAMGARYSHEFFSKTIRKNATKRIQWHKDRGDTVAIVSSSLNVYLRDWCREQNLELICTELEVKNNVLTGRYVGGDCAGEEKAKRVCEKYDLKSYEKIYAYGDTIDNDGPMLNLADKKYFRWQEVRDTAAVKALVTGKIDPNHKLRRAEIEDENSWLEKLVQNQ